MATYTYDVFGTLDGFGETAVYGGYWGKQGPELLARRAALLTPPQLIVFGRETYRQMAGFAAAPDVLDEWGRRMAGQPKAVLSRSSDPTSGVPDWPGTTVLRGDTVDEIRRLKADSTVPLRSIGSVRLNTALLAAGLVDRIQFTVFPMITAATGLAPVFAGLPDLDLELVESRTLDGSTVELTYVPTLR